MLLSSLAGKGCGVPVTNGRSWPPSAWEAAAVTSSPSHARRRRAAHERRRGWPGVWSNRPPAAPALALRSVVRARCRGPCRRHCADLGDIDGSGIRRFPAELVVDVADPVRDAWGGSASRCGSGRLGGVARRASASASRRAAVSLVRSGSASCSKRVRHSASASFAAARSSAPVAPHPPAEVRVGEGALGERSCAGRRRGASGRRRRSRRAGSCRCRTRGPGAAGGGRRRGTRLGGAGGSGRAGAAPGGRPVRLGGGRGAATSTARPGRRGSCSAARGSVVGVPVSMAQRGRRSVDQSRRRSSTAWSRLSATTWTVLCWRARLIET